MKTPHEKDPKTQSEWLWEIFWWGVVLFLIGVIAQCAVGYPS